MNQLLMSSAFAAVIRKPATTPVASLNDAIPADTSTFTQGMHSAAAAIERFKQNAAATDLDQPTE